MCDFYKTWCFLFIAISLVCCVAVEYLRDKNKQLQAEVCATGKLLDYEIWYIKQLKQHVPEDVIIDKSTMPDMEFLLKLPDNKDLYKDCD